MFRPRSILQLVLIGFLVVLLPVLAALVYGGQTLARLSSEQRDHIVSVGESAEYLQKLASDLVDIERLARQYLLLEDAALLQVFNQNIEGMVRNLAPFTLRSKELQVVVSTLQGLTEKLQMRLNREKDLAPSDQETFVLLDALAEGLAQLRRQTDLELRAHVDTAKARATATQRNLTILGFTVIPSVLILVGIFSTLITRPIRGIDQAIREIGTGIYRADKTLSGPRDLMLLGERVAWLRQRLHSSEESQERFLRHISHELKTPLATIKEGIELLADEIPGPVNASQRNVLDILQTGLSHFQALINNLLDFNIMRHDRNLNRVKIELKSLLNDAIRPYVLSAQRKQLSFELIGQPLSVRLDRSVITAALDNLLSNAVQFSPDEGKITLQWQSRDRGIAILVGDEGPGIPLEERVKVFLPFYQGKAKRNGPMKGTGLGLSVAKECVESHKGVLSILESEKGTWFELFLPQESTLV